MEKRFLRFAIIAVLTLALLVMVLQDVQSPIRSWLTFVVLLFCPGFTYISFLRLRDLPSEIAISIALSISLNVILSEIMVFMKIWNPTLLYVFLALVIMVGIFIQISKDLLRPMVQRRKL